MRVELKYFQKNGRLEPMMQDGQMINPMQSTDNYRAEENDNDAAVNYALRRNHSAQRENHTIKELMISATALPNIISGRPNSFAVLYLNLHSLCEHDKKTLGGLTEREIFDLNGEEYKSDDETDDQEQQNQQKGKSLQSQALQKINAGKLKHSNRRVFKRFAEGE